MPADVVNTQELDSFARPARRFATVNPNARFAVLRLWSAPHFYPLMPGHDNRDMTSWRDGIDRHWEWLFIPTDMPFSEWSMHKNTAMRIDPYKRQLKDRVVVKRNLYLVMGTVEEDLFRRACATTFAIQTRPWRLEVDFRKSFVNVDASFIEALDPAWLE